MYNALSFSVLKTKYYLISKLLHSSVAYKILILHQNDIRQKKGYHKKVSGNFCLNKNALCIIGD